MSNEAGALQLAVLIDADNVSPKIANKLFSEVAKLGDAPVRRVYGEFGGSAKGWKDAIAQHAIVPRQQFANVPNKNATDIALIIDAMDLLHAGRLDGFCLVSSDSDYTALATRLREQGLTVFGFGATVAAASFRLACHQFIEIEIPKAGAKTAATATVNKAISVVQKATKPADQVAAARDLLLRAFERLNGDEWVPLTHLLKEVRALQPQFTAKAYGSAKPVAVVRKTGCLVAELRGGTMMVSRKRPTVALAPTAKAA